MATNNVGLTTAKATARNPGDSPASLFERIVGKDGVASAALVANGGRGDRAELANTQ